MWVNYAMRVLPAVFNFVVHEYQLENDQALCTNIFTAANAANWRHYVSLSSLNRAFYSSYSKT
ncbi:phage related integrase [Legionella spiritensis]|nr:phage related integrase [Legionella spiritensis]